MSIPLRLLLVDNQSRDVEMMLTKLREAGFEPIWLRVATESDYVALLHTNLDLILADVISPEFHPLRALKLLREHGLDIPLIVVTGKMNDEAALECLKQGAADYLLKDRLARLGEAVTRALQKTYLRRERQQKQVALRRSESINWAVLNSVTTPLAVLNQDGTIIAVNETWSRSAVANGISPLVLTQIGVNYLDFCRRSALSGDAISAEALTGILAVLEGFQPNFTFEYRCHLVTEKRWFMMSILPLVDDAGGIVISYTDITERKLAEEALVNAERLRMELVKEREIIDLKQHFVSMVAHDFRAPLAVMTASHHLLRYYFDRLSPEQRNKHFDMIGEHIQHMVELVDDVLTLDVINAGKLEFNPFPIDLVAFCREVFQQMQLTDTGDHEFSFVAEGHFDTVSMDAKILRHILLNLLSNAIKYSPYGGEIRLQLSLDKQIAMLRISDQGIGIPVEDQGRVFEPFHRAQNAKDINGTGLGLAIVKHYVEAHEGTITFESNQGQGTTFTLCLRVRKL